MLEEDELAGTKKKARTAGKEVVEDRLVRALSNPIRARALAIFNERVASPKEISETLGVPVSKLSYHVRVLREFECIELTHTKQRRGATEHFYRGTTRSFLSDTNWERLSPAAKSGVSIAGLKMIFDAAKDAMDSNTFDSRGDRHLSCTPVVIDDRGWQDLTALLAGTLDRVLGIQAESAGRLVEAKADGMCASVSILGFETPPREQRGK
jgi:DNA-binding transcriptional ArsR family regulator